MRVYIAAPWVARDWVRVFAQSFDDRGIIITHRWWDLEGEFDDHEQMIHHAALDVNGVLSADVLVLYDQSKSEGKAVEQGLAIASGIPIVALGVRGQQAKNIFHHLDCYTWVDHPDKVWDALITIHRDKERRYVG